MNVIIAAPSDAFQMEGTPLVSQPVADSCRLLALGLNRVLPDLRSRSVAVVSASPGDGRSTVSVLLARALAEIAAPVGVIDADPFGRGMAEAPEIARSFEPPYSVLRLGRNGSGAHALFMGRLESAIEQGAAHGLTVVIDTPACLVSSAAFSIARMAGGVLYLAKRRARSTVPHHDIRAQLELVGAQLVGVAFNEG